MSCGRISLDEKEKSFLKYGKNETKNWNKINYKKNKTKGLKEKDGNFPFVPALYSLNHIYRERDYVKL